MCDMDWIHLAKDRDRWRVVIRAMNLRLPGTGGFARGAQWTFVGSHRTEEAWTSRVNETANLNCKFNL
jgi:hypothetical protein